MPNGNDTDEVALAEVLAARYREVMRREGRARFQAWLEKWRGTDPREQKIRSKEEVIRKKWRSFEESMTYEDETVQQQHEVACRRLAAAEIEQMYRSEGYWPVAFVPTWNQQEQRDKKLLELHGAKLPNPTGTPPAGQPKHTGTANLRPRQKSPISAAADRMLETSGWTAQVQAADNADKVAALAKDLLERLRSNFPDETLAQSTMESKIRARRKAIGYTKKSAPINK